MKLLFEKVNANNRIFFFAALYLEERDRNGRDINTEGETGTLRQRDNEMERDRGWWRAGLLLLLLISTMGRNNVSLLCLLQHAGQYFSHQTNKDICSVLPVPLSGPQRPLYGCLLYQEYTEGWFSGGGGGCYSQAVAGILLWCPPRALQLDTEPRNWFTHGCPPHLLITGCVSKLGGVRPVATNLGSGVFLQSSVCCYFWQLRCTC